MTKLHSPFRGATAGTFGSGVMPNAFSGFRRDDLDRRPGKAIPFHERPEGRPLAEELGNGNSYAGVSASGQTGRPPGKYQLKNRKADTYFREKAGLKIFTWEKEQ